jgi:hypothetical protein
MEIYLLNRVSQTETHCKYEQAYLYFENQRFISLKKVLFILILYSSRSVRLKWGNVL